MREVQPIIDEIQRLAAERRDRLALGTERERASAPRDVPPVDLREPVAIPDRHPLGWLLALADRVRSRILQAILIRQSEFNRRVSNNVTAVAAALDAIEREQERLQEAVDALVVRIAELDDRLCRAQALVAAPRSATTAPDDPGPTVGVAGSVYRDPIYAHLEAALRGDESTIRDRQRTYLDAFAGAEGPILDLGCGRGEFLELLRETRHAARGVDISPDNVRHCRAKGLDVVEADVLDYLSTLADASLGGIFSSQLVEHLPAASVLALVRACFAKLRPGARLVIETINTDALAALPIFHADPTHLHALPPTTAQLLLEACGFAHVELRYTSAFPPATRLAPSADGSPVAQQLDAAVDKLNQLLWGAREYAAIATR